MELCDLDLQTWIDGKWTKAIERKLLHLASNPSSEVAMGEIWDIMEDITNAIAFIHSEKEIHRDLKPRNS